MRLWRFISPADLIVTFRSSSLLVFNLELSGRSLRVIGGYDVEILPYEFAAHTGVRDIVRAVSFGRLP